MPLPVIAAQAIGQAAEFGLQQATAGLNNARQYKQQKKLSELQMKQQKQMTEWNMQKQLEMWEKTGYVGQRDQLERAGLNPGLLYGMSGGGGQTSNVETGNVTGGTAVSAPAQAMGLNGGMQMALLDAQRKNIEADTKLKEADANKTAGVDTAEAEKRIESLTQGITNEQQKLALMKIEEKMKTIETEVAGATAKDRISQTMWISKRALEELEQAQNITWISDETRADQIARIKAQAIEAVLRNALIKTQTDATKQGMMMDRLYYILKGKEVSNETQRTDVEAKKAAIMELTAKDPHEIYPADVLRIVEQAVDGILRKGAEPPRNSYEYYEDNEGKSWEKTRKNY